MQDTEKQWMRIEKSDEVNFGLWIRRNEVVEDRIKI
jgi:hypothetical protein